MQKNVKIRMLLHELKQAGFHTALVSQQTGIDYQVLSKIVRDGGRQLVDAEQEKIEALYNKLRDLL